ncbi:MAG: putative zinc-binding protein, partial [Candidatus Kapaibacteriales bacterium]
CSGASNTGCYTDTIARKMASSGEAQMLCLARFSVDKPWAETAKKDIENLIVLDGCPINCAEKIIKEARIEHYKHVNTTDFGIVKGKTPLIDERVEEIIEHIKKLNNE